MQRFVAKNAQCHGRTDDTTARPARQLFFMKNQPKIVYWNFKSSATRSRGRNVDGGSAFHF
jgi:hypothetical protein